MSDRSVRLDLAMSGLADHRAPQSGSGDGRDAASEEDVTRFHRALADRPPGTLAAAAGGPLGPDELDSRAAAKHEGQPQARGAFGLFGRARDGGTAADAASGAGSGAGMAASGLVPALAGAAQTVGPTPENDLGASGAEDRARAADRAQRLTDAVAERILVSADGGREVRVSIRADVLPGVELRLAQEAGRWVVHFAATDAASLELLSKAGEWMAGQLARRLRSDVEVRIADHPHEGASDEPVRTFRGDPQAPGDARPLDEGRPGQGDSR